MYKEGGGAIQRLTDLYHWAGTYDRLVVQPCLCVAGTGQGYSGRGKLPPFLATGKPLDGRLRMSQVVALRFAGDDEFVALAQRAAEEKMSAREIKQAIKNWRADYNRA